MSPKILTHLTAGFILLSLLALTNTSINLINQSLGWISFQLISPVVGFIILITLPFLISGSIFAGYHYLKTIQIIIIVPTAILLTAICLYTLELREYNQILTRHQQEVKQYQQQGQRPSILLNTKPEFKIVNPSNPTYSLFHITFLSLIGYAFTRLGYILGKRF